MEMALPYNEIPIQLRSNIHIINRADCKNDIVYYQKIYKIKLGYTKKYKSIVVNIPKNDK
jgi:hypothetical protein